MESNRMSSRVKCALLLEFASHEEALHVHRSIELDNQGYLSTKVEGTAILADISAESLNSLLHTLDDFLACVGVAEKIVSKKP